MKKQRQRFTLRATALLGTLLLGAAAAGAQSLTFSMKNTTIENVMDKIEQESDYTFLVLDRSIALNRAVPSIDVNDASVEQAMDKLLADTDISYRIMDRQIMLTNALSNASQQQTAQVARPVSGVVRDGGGNPLVGAMVSQKGKGANVSISDTDGRFSLEVGASATIEVRLYGFLTQEVEVTAGQSLSVTMQESMMDIDEVVVVGYGVQKKVNLTGAISDVKATELSAIPTSNFSNSLAGRAPGVTIVGNSGLVGASSSIRMRGGFGDPLFVIDGVISSKTAFDALEATEIDQINFLKDAATASIYGSRAGNGVVLIVTKRGDARITDPQFHYQGSYSISSTTKPLFSDLMNATDELTYQNRVYQFRNPGAAENTYPNQPKDFDYFRNRNYNVNDYIWQNPWNTKHSFDVTGGGDKFQYFVMVNYQREEGSYVPLNGNKYNIRSNLTAKLSNAITLNLNMTGYQTNNRRFFWTGTSDDDQHVTDMYRATFASPHTQPFYSNLDGSPADHKTEYPMYPEFEGWNGWNPADMVIGDQYANTRRRNLNSTLTLDANLAALTEGLSTKVMFNYTGNDYSRKRYYVHQKNYKMQPTADTTDSRFAPGPLDLTQYNVFGNIPPHLQYLMNTLWSEQFNWSVDYNRAFGKHTVAATAVFEQAENGGENVNWMSQYPLTSIDLPFAYSKDKDDITAGAGEEMGKRMSYIGRLNYNYADRYIAEFSFRYDGNTLFAPGNRWGFFPSVSLAWRIDQEAFMQNARHWLSEMKLRASYGTTGNDLDVNNQRIAAFSYLPKYSNSGTYIFGGDVNQAIAQGATPNPDLTWATSTAYNAGLDFGFFNNKLFGSIDAFYRSETNILGYRTVTLPSTYGQSLAPENYAARSWRGGEISLGWQDSALDGDIRYSVYANMGFSQNRWDVLDESAVYTKELQGIRQLGRSSGRTIGHIAVGLITTQEQVDELKAKGFKQYGRDPYLGGILYADTRSDGYVPGPDNKIDGNDYYNLLSERSTPLMNYGFGGEVSWKGISLSLHFQGVGPYDKFVGGIDGGFHQHGGGLRPYYPIWSSGDTWTPENPDGKYPRVVGSSWYESGVGVSTFWKRNGAYLRLKNLNLGYDLPKPMLKFFGLTQAQAYFNGTNLFSISELNEFMDPEQAYYDSYPLMRTFTFGLNFTF